MRVYKNRNCPHVGQRPMPAGEYDPREPPFSVMYVIYVDRDAACSLFHIAES